MNIKEMVGPGKVVKFSHYRKGSLYYKTDNDFTFPVPIDDCGDATFAAEDKAMLFMRYIRKALAEMTETEAADASSAISSTEKAAFVSDMPTW